MGLNDTAWARLFDRHDILEKVASVGFFEIDSDEVKKVRRRVHMPTDAPLVVTPPLLTNKRR